MSKELTDKMRDKLAAGFAKGDRIAELEEMVEACKADAREAEAYAEELEAKLEKAEVIVHIVASDKWDERLGEAVDLSCEYLADLKGQDDE